MDMAYFDKAADFLPDECFRLPPDLAIILGSGWGDALEKDKVLCRIPYAEIPGMGAPTVVGHSGEFVLYEHAGKRIPFRQIRKLLFPFRYQEIYLLNH